MRKLLLALICLLAATSSYSQSTLSCGVTQYSWNAASPADGDSGTAYALYANLATVTWQTGFGTTPSSVTLTLEGSGDNTLWATLDTSTSTAGEIRTITTPTVRFIRAHQTARTGGTLVSVILNCTKGGTGGGGGGSTTLHGLTDVDDSAKANTTLLAYNSGTAKWEAVAPTGGAPTNADYITATSNGTLSAERVCTASATVACDAGTAGQMKFNLIIPVKSTTGCTNPNFGYTDDTEAGECLVAADHLRLQTSVSTANNSFLDFNANTFQLYTYGSDGATAYGIQATGGDTDTGTVSIVTNGLNRHVFSGAGFTSATPIFVGDPSISDQFRLLAPAKGTVSHIGTITSTDLTVDYTWVLPTKDGTFAMLSDITGGMADPTANGIVVRTALNATTARQITNLNGGNIIVNPDGVVGDIDIGPDDATQMKYALGTAAVPGTGAPGTCYFKTDSNTASCYTSTNTPKTFANVDGATFTGTHDFTGAVLAGGSPLAFDGSTAGTNKTTLVITDPSANRTLTVPNANSVTIQPITCSGSDKVSAVSSLGVVTCSTDSTGAGTTTDDAVNVGNGTSSDSKVLPTCPDSGGNHLNYDASTNTFSCGTTGDGTGTSFDPGTSFSIYEEFPGSSVSNDTIGTNGWRTTLTAVGTVTAPASQTGSMRLNSHITSDDSGATLVLNNISGTAGGWGDWTYDAGVVIGGANSTAITNSAFWTGLAGSTLMHSTSNCIFVRRDTDLGDTTFMFQIGNASGAGGCQSAASGANTQVVASTITPTSGTEYRFRITRCATCGPSSSPKITMRVNSETAKTFCSTGCDELISHVPTAALLLTTEHLTRTTTGVTDDDLDWVYFTAAMTRP